MVHTSTHHVLTEQLENKLAITTFTVTKEVTFHNDRTK